MASPIRSHRRVLLAVSGLTVAALALTSRSSGSDGHPSDGAAEGGSDSITIGTTDKTTTIDPAASYDNGSFVVMNQVFMFLLNTPYCSSDVEPGSLL